MDVRHFGLGVLVRTRSGVSLRSDGCGRIGQGGLRAAAGLLHDDEAAGRFLMPTHPASIHGVLAAG